MKKVGLLGGTFNPIHNSHLLLAEQAYRQLNLDEVWFMPAKNPPHKSGDGIASDSDRCSMITLAISDKDYFKLCDIEMKREGLSYTSDTLDLLNDMYPDTRFFFIVGGDSLDKFNTWHEPEHILRSCALCCSGRADFNNRLAQKDIEALRKQYTTEEFIPEIYYLSAPMMNISSTVIRQFVSYDMSVSGMIPDDTAQFIREHKLYRSSFYDKVDADLKLKLKPSRYTHVRGVAATAVWLALAHNIDPDRAFTAGLLHDCAKYLDDEAMLAKAEEYHIELSDVERSAVQLVHSKVGSVIARDTYGIEDEEILSSIYWHTTGHPGMTPLEMIIYIADYIEPGRKMETTPSLDVVRSMAYSSLENTMHTILTMTVSYLTSTFKDNIATITLETNEYYDKLIKSKGDFNE